MKASLALIQMNFSADKRQNVEHAAERVAEAGRDGAQIIALPELATSEYFCYELNNASLALAEPIDGPSTRTIAKAAAAAGAYVVFPFYERGEDDQLYNSAAFISPAGEVVGRYRKNVIPLMSFPGVSGLEKYYFRPGNLGYPVFDTDLGIKVGITICYERHFPEGPRSLALAGADVIFVPTATPAGSGMWEVELRAMAIANLLWVAGINRVGLEEGGSDMRFYGKSLVSGPDGVVAAAAGDSGEQIVHAEIDTDASATLRKEWGFFRDRRPEIYEAITAP